jgi:hypothetical protein
MKNQVIKVLTPEHGKKVIEYWKSKGVDTDNYAGISCESDGDKYIYYGVINDVFDNHSITYVKANNNVEIIELPTYEFDMTYPIYDMTTNEGRMAYIKKHYPNTWAKIIKEDPEQEEKVMEKQKLSRQGLKEIHGVACSYWKGKLQGMGIRNPLEDYIELTQEEVDTIFKACTKEQLPIVSKYLKQDDGSVDLSNGYNGLIAVRLDYEYANKAFWLSPSYDWEIKKDSSGYKCLIPTKKK